MRKMLIALILFAVGSVPAGATVRSHADVNRPLEPVYGQGGDAVQSAIEKTRKEFQSLVKSFIELDKINSRSNYESLRDSNDFEGSFEDWEKRDWLFSDEDFVFIGDCGGIYFYGEHEAEFGDLVYFAF
jgi:hypothetical protein